MGLLTSYRFWTAVVGIAVIVAVYKGMPQPIAEKIAENVLVIVSILIGGMSLRGAGK
jgi:Na+/H+ antiporter NhaC